MDPVLLARTQFALTVGFHFIFPPITIGLAWLIFLMLTRYRTSGDSLYKQMARFWLKIFAVTFSVGVATGIVMEFQFGTNWSEYSRFVGDIFGAPLAAEGIFAFFLESTFMGVLLFGWNRLSRYAMWFASLMVALGSTLSAFWIIVANSWQQTPAGFRVNSDASFPRAEMTNFFEAVWNHSTIERYLHTIDASIITGSFLVLGISAWFLIRQKHQKFAQESFRIALIVAMIASVAQLFFGHQHAVQVANTQPAKIATFEGLYQTQSNAPVLLFGIPDPQNARVNYNVGIPGLLSLLIYNDPNGVVKGLDQFPRDEWPPSHSTFFSFHLMVYLGMLFILFSIFGLYLLLKNKLWDTKWFLVVSIWLIPLPIIANELGWIAAEVGRQPWAVYGLLKTSDSVSISVTAGEILASIIMFVLIYIVLAWAWIFIIRRLMKIGPEPILENQGEVAS